MLGNNGIPQGWTDKGVGRGWIKPLPSPHSGKLKKLEKENRELKALMQEILYKLGDTDVSSNR